MDMEEKLMELVNRDRKYPVEAYLFVFEALEYTQRELKRQGHVSGQELLEGIRNLASDKFGYLAATVFEGWNIRKTDCFGEIVFRLVDSKLMGKTDDDTMADFSGGYDFTKVFEKDFRITRKKEEEKE